MILSCPSKCPFMKKVLSQNAHFKTRRFPELVTKHLYKFDKEIDGYFQSLGKDEFAHIKNFFVANAQMLQIGTGTQEELQHDGFACDVYSEKYNSYVNL